MPRSILVGQAFLPDTINRGVRQESLTYEDAHYQAAPLLESRGRAAAPSFSLWTEAAIGDIVPSTRLKNSSIGFTDEYQGPSIPDHDRDCQDETVAWQARKPAPLGKSPLS